MFNINKDIPHKKIRTLLIQNYLNYVKSLFIKKN